MNFPRPPSDSGMGLHDNGEAGNATLDFMHSVIDRMADKRFKWLKIISTVDNNKVELARHCRMKGIMPIVRPYQAQPHPYAGIPTWFAKDWVQAGCPYIEVWNEPNLPEEHNKPYSKYQYGNIEGHIAFVNLLLDQWLKDADTIRNAGGIPLFPAMAPTAFTSDSVYFHHQLYKDVLDVAKQRGVLHWAFENAGVAIHNRPGDGQPLDKLDRCAFRDYEWIEETFRRYLGRDIPLFGTEGGYEGGMITDWFKNQANNLYPTPEMCLQKHRELNHEIFLRMNPAQPKAWEQYLICVCMWLTIDGAWHGAGWVHNGWANGGESLAWKHMDDIVPFTRWEGQPPQPPEPEPEPEPEPDPPGGGDMELVNITDEMDQYLSIQGPDDPDKDYWKITRVEAQPATDNQSAFAVIPPREDVWAEFSWPGRVHAVPPKSDSYAPEGAKEWAASMPMYRGWGSYCVKLRGNSDQLCGLGLFEPGNITYAGHHPTLVYFTRMAVEPSPDPPDVPPDPPDDPDPIPEDNYTLVKGLERILGDSCLVDLRDDVEEISDVDHIAKRSFGRIEKIVLHHTGSNEPQTAIGLAQWYIDQGNAGPPYHFVVGWPDGNDSGKVYFLGPLKWILSHAARNNADSIAIAVMGDYTQREPTPTQRRTLRKLILALWEFLGGGWNAPLRYTHLIGHKRLRHNDTACPGSLERQVIWGGPWPQIGRSL